MGWQGGQFPTQVLADQFSLSQPEGADCAPTLLLAHPALCSFLRRWWTVVSVWLLSFYLADLTKIGLNFGK